MFLAFFFIVRQIQWSDFMPYFCYSLFCWQVDLGDFIHTAFLLLFVCLFLIFNYLAVLGLSCSMRDLHCRVWDLQLWRACGIQFPVQGSNPGPLRWERRVLTAGPPGKSLLFCFLMLQKDLKVALYRSCFYVTNLTVYVILFYLEIQIFIKMCEISIT